MDTNIIVTIGIPFYNSSDFLEYAISSVLKQTYIDFELILSDDGSTDNSLEIAKSFNDKRIKIISDGMNKGIATRLNEQIKQAKGKYFARMDSDDLMFPDRIQNQVSFLENNKLVDVIGSSAVVINRNNIVIGIRKTKINKNKNRVMLQSPFIHPTVMGRTVWFKNYYYNKNLSGVEDVDLWYRSFEKSKFTIIEAPTLFYRDNEILNVKTYYYRNKKLLKNTNNFRNKIEIICKIVFVFTLSSFNLSKKIVMSRNLRLKPEIKAKFEKIMASVISTQNK